MARTATTGFFFRRTLYGLEHPGTQRYIIGNSSTIKIGDAVRINTAGFLVRAAAGEAIAGVVDGLVDLNGVNVFSSRATGTTGSTLTPDDQVAVSSTNQSDGTRNIKADVIVDPAGICLFYNDADSSLADTNRFQFSDSSAAGNQIVLSASDSAAQWQLMVLDPDGDADLSKGLWRIAENQFGLMLDSATAKNAA